MHSRNFYLKDVSETGICPQKVVLGKNFDTYVLLKNKPLRNANYI